MSANDPQGGPLPEQPVSRHTLPMPGFITSESIGLGTVLKRITASVGIQPCAGCRERAAALDRFLTLSPHDKHRP